jgi:hypothetical protein
MEPPQTFISSSSYYGEYHGHKVAHLTDVLDYLRSNNDRVVFLAGDSSLDNKHWFSNISYAVNGYENILRPPESIEDISHWMNWDMQRRGLKGRLATINCAVEESTIGARSCGILLQQDLFIRDNIQEEDVLVISVGGNDIALAPTPCTGFSIASLLACSTTELIKHCSCGCAIPVDDCCGGFSFGTLSMCCACPFGMGYLVHLFGTRVKALVERLIAKKKPKLVMICMIYFLDETPGNSWAETVLRIMGYNSNPAKLQEAIRQIFRLATQTIHIPGVTVQAVPLFEVLDGKTTTDYCERVEPSAQGGQKMGEFLVEMVLEGLKHENQGGTSTGTSNDKVTAVEPVTSNNSIER